jgi:hypothetical protein
MSDNIVDLEYSHTALEKLLEYAPIPDNVQVLLRPRDGLSVIGILDFPAPKPATSFAAITVSHYEH